MSAHVLSSRGVWVLVPVLMAAVHGAVLKSTLESVEAGQHLPLVGEDFHEGMTVSLVLVGLFDEYSLGSATADDEGGFTMDVEIPVDAQDGDYHLVAYEPSGERAAALDVVVLAASASAEHVHDEVAGHDAMQAPMPTAEEMVITRSTTGAGWAVVGLVVGLAGGLGIALLRGAAAGEA